jgi:3-phosphoshikimate 1-carboxyvinyltransferase
MKVAGTVRLPGDKSISHRALLLAGLADGPSALRGLLTSNDVRSTAGALRALGVSIGPLRAGATVGIHGGAWRTPTRTIHCGNSGTTARLLLGLLAGRGVEATLTGDRSLRTRPMARVTAPLRAMGAELTETRADRLPVTTHPGPLRGIAYQSPVASAQVKSALLLAGLASGATVTVTEPYRSRDHTERMLGHLGLPVTVDGRSVTLEGADRPAPVAPFELTVPGDISSAAFLLGAALLADAGELRLAGVGVNPTRTGMLRVLERMGAPVETDEVRREAGEPVADLVVRPGALHATTVAPSEVPTLIDEIPMLAVLASRAEGRTTFVGVGELRVKESNRLDLLAQNLRAVGVDADADGDTLAVEGGSAAPRGHVETAGDHRLAMAFTVLSTVPGAAVTLSERTSPRISFPGFAETLAKVLR